MTLDSLDRRLLNLIQARFPITPEPYRELAEALGASEEEILGRLERLVADGVIRRLGPIFDSRKLGYCSTLVALKVPSERVEEVAAVVNSFPGVTHNYLRDDRYNMWFTLLEETPARLEATLKEIKRRTGITEILNLPAARIFKLRVNFDLGEE